MDITEEMLKALRSAQREVWRERAPISQGDAVEVAHAADVAGLAAVAPLIAAQALRPSPERVAQIAAALEEENSRRPLVDFWLADPHGEPSAGWVRPDWAEIVRAVADHLATP
jgi:hypothetical protein